MTTLKDFIQSRACKVGLAVMLAVSMVPVAALSTVTAFAEETQAEQAVSEPAADEQAAVVAAVDEADEAPEPAEAADAPAVEPVEAPADEPAEPASEASDEEPVATEPAEETDGELNVSDFQMETLQTTVEDEPFSFWAPFRLIFGADNSFRVPLKTGNYVNWIDRLDLSGAIDENGANYARNFYDILVEGSDNDNYKDVLIDNTSYSSGAPVLSTTSPASRATVGNPYRVNATTGLLVAIVDDPEVATAGSEPTTIESHVRQYVNETYGAFDRDYPSSFWRGVNFGTMFVRDEALNKTMCFFGMKNSSFDLRAQGYDSQTKIRAGIDTLNARAKAISDAFEAQASDKTSEVDRVKFYDNWLCAHNVYNESYNSIAGNKTELTKFQNAHPDVWSAMAALVGRSGEDGPVCESYSRAMQLLCQKAGIGCVVVDGDSSAGAHMWNYVRIGSGWYALDTTWNDTGDESNGLYVLVGGSTGSPSFLNTHTPKNQFTADGVQFLNGPVLSATAYDPRNVSFAGIITTADTFPYGDRLKLEYASETEGEIAYTLVEGSNIAEIIESETPAESIANGGLDVLKINGVGTIKVRATLTPTESAADGVVLTADITITAGPRSLTVGGTVLAPKVYDGMTDATVLTPGQLQGVLSADSGKLSASATGARYNSVKAGASVSGNAFYKLEGDANTLKLYTLEGSEVDANATGTITKRPVTAYFALSSTRVLTTENLPGGTVRYEAASTGRGKLDGDNLMPSLLAVSYDGMPDSMPTLAAGTSRIYTVTCTTSAANMVSQLEDAPDADNYSISFESNPVELTIVNLENTEVFPGSSPSNGATYRVEARLDNIDASVAKLTEANSGYTSVESVIAKLLETLTGKTAKPLTDDRVRVYDMTLFVQDENGAWEEATTENFPDDGVRVTVPYPDNTAGNTHDFYVAHMFTGETVSNGAVHKPGEVESPQVVKGTDGPSFVLSGFSPVSVAWEEARTTPADGNPGDFEQNTHQTGASNVSQTGDSLPVLSITVIALACIVLIVALAVRRNRDKKGDPKE